MTEVLHDVEAVSVANHAQPDHVVGRVEQVGAMRGRKHQMFVAMQRVIIESDIFAFLIQKQTAGRGEALWEGGFVAKLMRELSRL